MSLGRFGGSAVKLQHPFAGGGESGGSTGGGVGVGDTGLLGDARDANLEGAEAYGGIRPAVGSFTRDTSVASGTQAVTGVGYKPRIVILFMSIESGAGSNALSWGLSNVTSDVAARMPGSATNDFSITKSISFVNGADSYEGEVSSFDADGFTVTWTRTGTPTTVIRVGYACFR